MRHQMQQTTRAKEEIRKSIEPYREQIMKVIPKERLDYLLTLSEEQLDNMDFEALKGTPGQ